MPGLVLITWKAARSHLAVGVTILDHEAAEIEGIGGCLTGFFHSDAFALAELEEEGSIFVKHFLIVGVNEGGLFDVGEFELIGLCIDLCGVADEYYLGNALGNDACGSCECARFGSFGEYDALARRFGFRGKFFKKSHTDLVVL